MDAPPAACPPSLGTCCRRCRVVKETQARFGLRVRSTAFAAFQDVTTLRRHWASIPTPTPLASLLPRLTKGTQHLVAFFPQFGQFGGVTGMLAHLQIDGLQPPASQRLERRAAEMGSRFLD